jgi:hypothetical protein
MTGILHNRITGICGPPFRWTPNGGWRTALLCLVCPNRDTSSVPGDHARRLTAGVGTRWAFGCSMGRHQAGHPPGMRPKATNLDMFSFEHCSSGTLGWVWASVSPVRSYYEGADNDSRGVRQARGRLRAPGCAGRDGSQQASLLESAGCGGCSPLADIISNTPSISKHDPGFARRYVAEMRHLVPLLTRGNADLQRRARAAVGLP